MSDIDVTAPSLAELATHHSEKWRGFAPDVIPLPVAEMDFPVAAPIREFLHSMVEHSDMGYLGPIPELGTSFAAFTAARWNWNVDPLRVRVATDVGVGVVEILRAFTHPGDGVLISSPVYQNFYTWMNETKVKSIDVPFIHQSSSDVSLAWSIDWQGIEKAYSSGIKIHLLCSPHNPIGRIYTKEELSKFVTLAAKYNVTIISDEIHSPLVFKSHEFVPFLAISETAREVGVTVTSASKGWNIAGLKSAVIVSQNKAIDEVLALMPPAVKFRSSILGAFASAAAFKDGGVWLDSVLETLEENSLMVRDLLSAKLPSVKTHLPQSSYVAWLDLTSLNLGENPAQTLLERGKVAFNAGYMYGPQSSQFVRLNYATSPTILTEAIDRIVKSL